MSNRSIDDMEDIIDPLLMRKRSGKYIATMLASHGFGRLSNHADVWDAGYLAGLADMQNGQERPNPYRVSHLVTPDEAEIWRQASPSAEYMARNYPGHALTQEEWSYENQQTADRVARLRSGTALGPRESHHGRR